MKNNKKQKSSFTKDLKSAGGKHDARRRLWLMSDDGVRDGLDSVYEIFSLIESRLSENALLFETLGIELDDKSEFLRSVSNHKFGCQIELTRFLKYSHNHLINLRLEIILFSKTPTKQDGSFNANFVSGFSLKADLTPDNRVVWKDDETVSSGLTAKGVCEKMFGLVINQTG